MFLKSNVHLKELADFLQENFSEYVFNPDAQLNLIEIITMKNAKKGKHESENVLAVGDDNKVRLIFFEHNSKILDIEKQAQEFMITTSKSNYERKISMDKEKIMNQLQQKMSKQYPDVEVVEYLGCLALKAGDEIIAHFRDWDADHYYTECGPNYTEWALSNGILLEFYKEGRKLLKKKPIKKYAVKVLQGKSAERRSSYLNVNYRLNLVSFENGEDFEDWRASFTKKEIEELQKRDDIAIDWDKVELEEVDDDK